MVATEHDELHSATPESNVASKIRKKNLIRSVVCSSVYWPLSFPTAAASEEESSTSHTNTGDSSQGL